MAFSAWFESRPGLHLSAAHHAGAAIRLDIRLADDRAISGTSADDQVASALATALWCLRRAHGVGHGGATGAERLLAADRAVARGLMLDLGIELRSDQDDDDGEPHPHHQADGGA